MQLRTKQDALHSFIRGAESKRPAIIPKFLYRVAYICIVTLALLFTLIDALFSRAANRNDANPPVIPEAMRGLFTTTITPDDWLAVSRMPLYGQQWLSMLLLTITVLCLLLILVEMSTYKPVLFDDAESNIPNAEKFFSELTHFKDTDRIEQVLREVQGVRVESYKRLKEMEEKLILATKKSCGFDTMRSAITLWTLARVLVVVVALGLCTYFTSSATDGYLLKNISPDAGLLRHIYYVMTTFFTIGSDIYPYPYTWGYLFVAVSAMLLVFITYFIISSILSSFFEFENNVRHAAHYCVLSQGDLKSDS